MDLDQLVHTLPLSEQSGHVISVEEGLVLHNSLLILQNENHFRKIFFWGKILGTENDYYLAVGYRTDFLEDRIFYYSIDCLHWGLLPQPKEYAKQISPMCFAKFQGDPSLMLDVLLEKDETAFGKPLKDPQVKKLKEEDRLAATIFFINEEAAVVPRGAAFKRTDGVVVENRTFEGLQLLEAREIVNFLHLRKARQKWNTNLVTRDDYNLALDFLDPLDIDRPHECWTHMLTAGDEYVVLKSLYWPGMLFYHCVATPKHGFIYFGNGLKCLDIPFMISELEPSMKDYYVKSPSLLMSDK